MEKKYIRRILAAAVPALLLAASPSEAAVTCKIVPQWCPSDGSPPSASVPEPATIALLATGFGAAGFVAWRRRKRK
jgi:hypothetical protein